jgi:beta-aspartyl-peptidase (threonine type)
MTAARSALLSATLLLAVIAPGPAAAGWALAIHGGVNGGDPKDAPAEEVAAHRAGLAAALEAGAAVLRRGGSAMDAVEAAVRLMEDDPAFNAGRGAVLTFDGRAELDAAIMDGATRRAGAVAGVTTTRNPISLARRVMERTRHVMLARDGADAFSREQGLEQVAPEWFVTDAARRDLEAVKARGQFDGRPAAPPVQPRHMGTVGAVARDSAGNIAAATSTGGLTAKRWGRIGDAPIIGAGTYADNRGCAVSATGSGEYFIRLGVAHEICARVRLGGDAIGAAAHTVVNGELKALGGEGGVILMGRSGPGDWAFTTPIMSRARIAEGTAPDIRIHAAE